MFGMDYRLSLFLSSWRDGGQKGLIHGDRKWIYTKYRNAFEMNLDDSGIIDLTGDPQGPFVRFRTQSTDPTLVYWKHNYRRNQVCFTPGKRSAWI